MANAHSTPDTPISKTERRCVVGYRPQNGNTSTPALTLSGKWLREAGFETGVNVTVRITDGCIVLIPDSDEVQQLQQQLYKIKQLVNGLKAGMVNALSCAAE
ncbi:MULTISPECIES: SymE family type I addiction module toxin [Lonsdalea]|uniref:Toxin SymE, type I toxin-antitoxin system family protein n=2 Tax=Lonsdalea TaxID=1082702 RepID=A0ACD1J7X1_9GAMM|nr:MULTISPECIES: SymE family type I addiction module toxin [Lonsdalea]OSM93881.1 toxin SymE, type I toxin-antitoxin system family protein [Lonsdalea populi]QPQ23877.1 SymE family type I addiction module toxin [Lonsdalea populi]RAT09941.1 toxin SymE, type I toxin-antitoxin system family protein [Lonsdalea quercina]RAT16063.1 toxin SymE, type I toxin-antitoxin system family protein [Lonsdalea populi]RAT18830.1 toxin SymE, type I toxin-antitoxin system family protein [Lonsdalea populi]